MVDEYIRRQEMLEAVDHLHIIPSIDGTGKPTPTEDFRVQFLGTVLKVKSADVVPVRHGRWLPIVSYNNTYKCSECGRLLVDITDGLKMVAKHYPYCHCGAKMDAQGEE